MLSLKIDGEEFAVKTWKFPAGEVGVKIENTMFPEHAHRALITLNWQGNDDLLALVQLVDAVRHVGVDRVVLDIPYFPYSRQDRRCFKGEGHALKMVGDIINSLGFERVYTKDAHSYVLEAVVDNLFNIEQHICAAKLPKHDVLIAPDNGASKKIYKLAQEMDSSVVIADKQRDNTGKIVSSKIDLTGWKEYTSMCVVDDLCDYGGTFLALGKEIRKQTKDNEVNLYVTHGFFGKGVDELLKLYDNVYVHNLMNKDVEHLVKII